MKIFLSSVGRRGYLVNYFKEALLGTGQVWGGDNSPYSPAFAYCDRTWLLPEVSCPAYADKLLEICRKGRVDILIPLIDPELEVLAQCRDRFEQAGIMVVVSPPETIEICYDKFLTYQFAKSHKIGTPETVLTVEQALAKLREGVFTWPLAVKPRRGSASNDITYCQDEIQLRGAMDSCPQPMIQQIIEGKEYGCDLFGDRGCHPVSVYCKRKLAMRAGETDKAVSTNDPALVEFGRKLLESMKLFGPVDVDVMVDADGPKLLEINPRFGGGYPCAHLAGADFCRKLIDIRNGKKLTPDIGSCPAGICMLKQDEIIRPDWDGLPEA